MKIFLVGGAVRDTVLGLQPKDRDYVIVGATMDDISQMIEDGFTQVGADFPVFLHPITGDEYALARIERKTGDGYNGFTVETKDVELDEDLFRRDITINAMAQDLETSEIIDPFGGLDDLKQGIIRHVSDAFAEDPLRVLRVARFVARYNFKVANETLEFMRDLVINKQLDHLSKERIWVELEKILSEKNSIVGLKMLEDLGALESILGARVNLNDLVEGFEKMDVLNKFVTLTNHIDYDPQTLAAMRIPSEIQKGHKMFADIFGSFMIFDILPASDKVRFIKRIDALGNTTTFRDIRDALTQNAMGHDQTKTLDASIKALKSMDCAAIAADAKSSKDIAAAIFNARVKVLSEL